jgi:hypothetical protein
MDSQPQGQTAALIARIAASRTALGNDYAHLRRRWHLPARIKDSILSKPVAWFGGSLGMGFLASLILRRPRPRESKPKRSLIALALGGAFTLARPALQSWAVRELGKRFVIPGNDTVRHS